MLGDGIHRALAGRGSVLLIAGEAGNFCSGGDVRDIIGPLTGMDMSALLRFTRMTGDLVKAIRSCPQPVISAIDGVKAATGRLAVPEDTVFVAEQGKPGGVVQVHDLLRAGVA